MRWLGCGCAAGILLLAAVPGWAQVLPDLVPLELQLPGTITAPPNPTVRVAWHVANQGEGVALGWWTDALFFSRNPWWDNSAVVVWSDSGPMPLEEGDDYWRTNRVTLPVVETGTYYLFFHANANDTLQETSKANNELAQSFDFIATPADLAPISLVVPVKFSGPPKPFLPVVWGVTNQGPGSAIPTWSDAVYFSSHPSLDETAVQVLANSESSAVPVGGAYWRTNVIRLPAIESGTYYLFFKADANNALHESEAGNNIASAAISLTVQPPDLAALAFQVPAAITGAPNPSSSFVYGVTNQGADAWGDPPWWDAIYLSEDPQLDASDRVVVQQYIYQPVFAGGDYWVTNTFNVPVVSNGTWYLVFKTDSGDAVVDANRANNAISVPVSFTILPPDLVPIAWAPSVVNGPPYPEVTVVFGSTNQGAGNAAGYWTDSAYFSTTPSLDGASGLLSSAYPSGLPPGGAYWSTNSVRLPVIQDGDYYLIFRSDAWSSVPELDASNNLLALPITVHIHPPDLSPVALQLPNLATSPPMPEVSFVWAVTNQGLGAAIGNYDWLDQLYFSTNSVWNNSAVSLGYWWERGPVARGETYWRTNLVRLPLTQSGTYYFFLRIDANDTLVESDNGNNMIVAKATFTIEAPDLAPLVSEIPQTITGLPNPQVALIWGVTNLGPGLARAPWWDSVYLSSDDQWDWGDSLLDSGNQQGPLAAGDSYWVTNIVRVPVTKSSRWYLIFKADNGESLFEVTRANNIAVVPVTFRIEPPDLVPELVAPPVITGPPNPTATIAWRVQNQGSGAAGTAGDSWGDVLYLSRDTLVDGYDYSVGGDTSYGPLAPGGSYWRTNTVRLPVTRSRTRYLLLQADNYNSVVESDDNNNTAAVPVRFEILPPDLAPLGFLAPDNVTGTPNPTVTLVWGVTNQGTGLAEPQFGSWADRVYLATNDVFDETCVQIGELRETAPLAAGGSYWRTNQLTVPALSNGTYYLFFVTDIDRSIVESDYNNNLLGLPVTFTILAPDLEAISLQAPAVVNDLPRPQITVSWGVTNRGPGAAKGSWRDTFYLSRTLYVDGNTPVLRDIFESGPLEPGETYWRTNTLDIPVLESGIYYLVFKTDVYNELHEADQGNNKIAVPIAFQISPPDLAPFAIQVPTVVTGMLNPSLTIAWGVTNQGTGSTARGPGYGWSDRLFLCAGPPPENGGIEIGNFAWNTPLGPGESGWVTNTLRLPVVESGTYYLMVFVNLSMDLYESCYTNNQYWVPIEFHLNPPDLAPILLRAPAEVTAGLNPLIKLTWGVTNQGPGTAQGYNDWSDRVYVSRDAVLDSGDTPFIWTSETGPVTPGGAYWRSQSGMAPVTESGLYYLILSVDHDHMMHDHNYSNNVAVTPVRINIEPPDLAPLAWNVPSRVDGSAFEQVSLVWGVTNQGIGPASPYSGSTWYDRVYLSTSPNHSWSDRVVASSDHGDSLAPGADNWHTNTVELPVTESGDYYWIFEADSGGAVAERCETNNLLVLPVTINVAEADLGPVALQAPLTVTGSSGPTINVVYAVTNSGPGKAKAEFGWRDVIYFSKTNTLGGTEPYLSWLDETNAVLPGQSYWRTNQLLVPVRESGDYFLILNVDSGQQVHDLNYSNNTMVVGPMHFNIQPSDVAPVNVQAPSTVYGGSYPHVSAIWGITNQGAGDAFAFMPSVYFSQYPVFGSNMGSIWVPQIPGIERLAPGEVCWLTNEFRLPAFTNGTYYLFFNANPENWLAELNTNNDIVMVPISFEPGFPDLAPVALLTPRKVTGQAFPTVQIIWGVTNQAPVDAEPLYWSGSWADTLRFSRTTNAEDGIVMQPWLETNTVPAGGSYWRTNHVRLPVTESGDYFLIFTANARSIYYTGLEEADFSNNVAIVPITVDIRPPDLAVLGFQAPALITGQPYPEVTVVWGITNQGIGPAEPPIFDPRNYTYEPLADAVFLSNKPGIDDLWGQPICGYWQRTEAFLPGAFEWHTNTLRVPTAASGSYYLVFKTDVFDAMAEPDKANNSVAVPVRFQLSPPADLAASRFIVPRIVTGAGNPTIQVAWQVANEGVGPVSGSWMDQVLLFGGPYSGVIMARYSETNSLSPGDSYWRTNWLTLPITDSGDFELMLRAGEAGPFDLDWNNNAFTAPITFHITGPPAVVIRDVRLFPGGTFSMSVYGVLGAQYQLQASSDFMNWTRVLDFVCTYDPTPIYDMGGAFERRFYRIAPIAEAAPLRLDFAPWRWTSDTLWLRLDGPVGSQYRVETSTDLSAWTTLTNLQTDVSPMYFWDPAAGGQERTFYRAVRE